MFAFKWFFKGGVREAISQVAWVYVWPLMLTGGSTLLLYFQGVPWGYLSVGALAAFAFALHGLTKLDDWRMRRQIDGKLDFVAIKAGYSVRKDGIVIGIELRNTATFPIEFKVKTLSTKIGDRVPSKNQYPSSGVIVPALGVGWFNDHPINIESRQSSGVVDGSFEYNIKYGRVNRLKYNLCGKKGFVLSFNEDGTLTNVLSHDVRC